MAFTGGKLRQSENDYVITGREVGSFGTAVAGTTFIRQTGATFTRNQNFQQSKSQLGTRLMNGSYPTTQTIDFSMPFEADGYNLGFLLQAALGAEAVSGAGPYIHTFTPLNSAQLPSYTNYLSVGNYKNYALLGCTLDSLSLDIAPKALITGTSTWCGLAEVDQSVQCLSVTANVITTAVVHGLVALNRVRFFPTNNGTTSGVLPTGLTADTDYYVSATGLTTTAFSVSATSGGAVLTISAGTVPYEVVGLTLLAPPTFRSFAYQDVSCTVNATAFYELSNFKITVNNNLFKDDFRAGNAGQLASLPAGMIKVSGSFAVAFDENSNFLRADFTTGTSIAMVITCLSNIPITGGFMTLVLTLPTVQITDCKTSGQQILLNVSFDVIGAFSVALTNDKATVFA